MIKFIFIAISYVLIYAHIIYCNEFKVEMSNILQSFGKTKYEKSLRPNYGGQPLRIDINMSIRDISSVSEYQMDFSSDLFLRQSWNDERLAFNKTNGIERVNVGADFINKIWIPDTHFVNTKQTVLHTSSNLKTNALLSIESNGNVSYSLRVTVLVICQMDLKYFPMDSQICGIELESFGYTSEDVEYHWLETNTSKIVDSISLPNFRIVDYWNENMAVQYLSGNYSRLIMKIMFRRSVGYYLSQVYIPAMFIVTITWIPFWLGRDDSHARVGLGVTTVLTMTTLMNTNASMPRISYMKSLDIYLKVCFAMVFASLIQYAVVGYLTYKRTKSLAKNVSLCARRKRSLETIPDSIDYHSRWIFPTIFILFTLIYWFTHLTLS